MQHAAKGFTFLYEIAITPFFGSVTVMNNDTFTFASTSYEPLSGVAYFRYRIGDQTFTETLELTPGATIPEQILFALHLALGVSYWKAYCSPTIVIESGTLTREQATFWNTLYTKGLGEFFYVNEIDFRGRVNFPYDDAADPQPVSVQTHPSALVPIGGGKDSLVSIELLQKGEMPFSTFTLGRYDVIEAQRTHINTKHHTIKRTLDKQLFALNEQGAYNGHVPISSIYAFTAVLQAMLTGQRYVVLSNERSASYGNVEYLGEHVNHQWSKSLEFEKMINSYVHDYITPDVEYFSLLRPLYEIAIAREFAQHDQWLSRFTSCNRNFAIQKKIVTLIAWAHLRKSPLHLPWRTKKASMKKQQ
jgi:hypothetical protein